MIVMIGYSDGFGCVRGRRSLEDKTGVGFAAGAGVLRVRALEGFAHLAKLNGVKMGRAAGSVAHDDQFIARTNQIALE